MIYQIYPRSFFDSNGDGIGDLAGIVRKLDYIAGLGVDAVWISPFFVSPMCDFGYDVADFRGVDPVFGTLDDFDRLVARAHALGLKVLIDQIWGHSSDRHPWFLDSRRSSDSGRAEWYVWADPKPDGTPPNNWLSVFGGPAWQWEPRRRQYYLHHFLPSQPTLNLRNEAVVTELLDIGTFWLDRGIDGFRLDAVDFLLHDPGLRDNPPEPPPDGNIPAKLFGLQRHVHDMLHPDIAAILRRIRGLMDRYPGRTTLAEVSSQSGAFERIGGYTEGNDQLHMAYTLQPSPGRFDRAAVRRLHAASGNRRGWAAWSFSNHDVERAVSRWPPSPDAPIDPDFARLLMGLMLSLRGSISVYQGEELALPDATVAPEDMRDPFGIAFYPEYRGRDGSRTPMPWIADAPQAGFTAGIPWLPIDPHHIGSSVDRQESDPGSALQTWRRFLRWRRAHPALIDGDLDSIEAPEPLVAFRRSTREESVLVVLNLSNRPAPLPETLLAGTHPLSGHGFAVPQQDNGIVLPRYGMLFAAAETVTRE
ncbi:MAG TPA: alpha-glucosidase [Stellaceae bacterium]|nr:alpha-glucosidase [Stellaceae bacterium]